MSASPNNDAHEAAAARRMRSASMTGCFRQAFRAAITVALLFCGSAQHAAAQETPEKLTTLAPPPEAEPPRPWAEAALDPLPPGKPGRDYTPAVIPNGSKAEYQVIDGVKVFHLVAEPIEWEVGLQRHGSRPGA